MNELPADPLFLEAGLNWRAVSPRLITERRLFVVLLVLSGLALMTVGALVHRSDVGPWQPLVLLGLAIESVAAVLWFVVVPRMVASWRYAERQQDLLIRHGRIFRRLTVVPYGRMQVIEVSANPISARLGIATVTLVTASANTNAKIPGLPTQIAQELRDQLAAKGEAMTAGL
ncbi:MAG: PH domain-containing protein [Nocardioidaceae bacterium]